LSTSLDGVNHDDREFDAEPDAATTIGQPAIGRLSASTIPTASSARPHRADASMRHLSAAMDRGDRLPSQRARRVRAAVATAHAPLTCEAAM
jgi:hypothetical protein